MAVALPSSVGSLGQLGQFGGHTWVRGAHSVRTVVPSPGQKLPCASGAYGAREAGTRGPCVCGTEEAPRPGTHVSAHLTPSPCALPGHANAYTRSVCTAPLPRKGGGAASVRQHGG